MNTETEFKVIGNEYWEDIINELCDKIQDLNLSDRVESLNYIRLKLHKASPFKEQPVDLIQWVKSDTVGSNEYNPNSVAPVEMELLRLSINEDGYTMGVVTMPDPADATRKVVIDGAHRTRCSKEYPEIKERLFGYVPIVTINEDKTDMGSRMSSTVRHNRARGTHAVDKMSDIVLDLKKRNWSDEKIAKNLGMDADEVLRLGQISGLAEMFAHREFSEAWESEGEEIENELIIEE